MTISFAQAQDLPTEIVRDIFEYAANEDRYTATILDRVSYQVHEWMNPILYTIVVLDSANSLIPFAEIVRTAPDTSIPRLSPALPTGPMKNLRATVPRNLQFYATTVKYLSITHASIPFHYIRHLFISLTSVNTLELDTCFPFPRSSMKPIELIAEAIGNPDLFTHPMFCHITRLWLCRPVALAIHHKNGRNGSIYPPTLEYIAVPLRIGTYQSSSTPKLIALNADMKRLDAIRALDGLKLIVVNLEREHLVLSGRSALFDLAHIDPQNVWEDLLWETLDDRVILRAPKYATKEPSLARDEGLDLWTRAQRTGTNHPLLLKK